MTSQVPAAGRKLCPSARNTPGASLIGVVDTEDRVLLLDAPRVLDADTSSWLDGQGGERAFRFADTCRAGGCPRWQGSCEVGTVVARAAGEAAAAAGATLPACAIRADCRWWDDQGPAACAGCVYVITDLPRGSS